MERRLFIKVVLVSAASVVLTLLVIVGVAYAADIFTVDRNGAVYLRITTDGSMGIGASDPESLSDTPAVKQIYLGIDGSSGSKHTGTAIKAPVGYNSYCSFIPDGNTVQDQWSIGANTADYFYIGRISGGLWQQRMNISVDGTVSFPGTGAMIVHKLTTAQRDALTAADGMIIYNTSTSAFNFRENGAWVTK